MGWFENLESSSTTTVALVSGGLSMQAEAPAFEWVSLGQSSQVIAPGMSANIFSGHWSQLFEPAVRAYVPTAQAVHAAVPSLNVPAGQATQLPFSA